MARASALQAEGQEFESPNLHHYLLLFCMQPSTDKNDFSNGEIGEMYVILELMKVANGKFVPLKAYKNQNDWDIVCISPDKQKVCTIQVKYRSGYTNLDNKKSIIDNNFDCIIIINDNEKNYTTIIPYIIPKNELDPLLRKNGKGCSICAYNILSKKGYANAWNKIVEFFQ